MAVEVVVGIAASSLALLADAGHMLADAGAITFARGGGAAHVLVAPGDDSPRSPARARAHARRRVRDRAYDPPVDHEPAPELLEIEGREQTSKAEARLRT